MTARKELLRVSNLKTYFWTEGTIAKAVDGVDFNIYEGEVLGIVGESGSGKSVSALSILRLIPNPPGDIVGGEITFRGTSLLDLSYQEMRKVRGNEISMIFQEPMTSLNPVFTIGKQIMEPIILHQHKSKDEAAEIAIEMLDLVGIPSPRERLKDYPHQFSGGMRQRAMIAMALACDPYLLIADEPTTALDVTIQAQILDLMLDVKAKKREAAILLITHDLAVIAETCQRVVVMYCGRVQEIAEIETLFEAPKHPYTVGLLKSLPSTNVKSDRLYNIRGSVPSILELPEGCAFSNRCDEAMDICQREVPDLLEIEDGHFVRCHLYDQLVTK